jgi:hypothetical protein
VKSVLPAAPLFNTAIALFISGIFWMMVWFVIENRRAVRPRRGRFELFAVALMIVSAYLMLDIVVHPSTFFMPSDAPVAAAPLASGK